MGRKDPLLSPCISIWLNKLQCRFFTESILNLVSTVTSLLKGFTTRPSLLSRKSFQIIKVCRKLQEFWHPYQKYLDENQDKGTCMKSIWSEDSKSIYFSVIVTPPRNEKSRLSDTMEPKNSQSQKLAFFIHEETVHPFFLYTNERFVKDLKKRQRRSSLGLYYMTFFLSTPSTSPPPVLSSISSLPLVKNCNYWPVFLRMWKSLKVCW